MDSPPAVGDEPGSDDVDPAAGVEPPAPDVGFAAETAQPQFSRGQLQRFAVRGAYWTFLHTLISLPIAFAVNIVLARTLGAVDYGRLAYLTSIMAIVGSIISMGVGTGAVQYGAKAHATGRGQEVKDLLSTSQAIRMLTAAPVMTLVVVSIAEVGPVLLLVAVLFGVFLPSVLGNATYCFAIENKTAEGAKHAMIVNLLTQGAVLVAIFTAQTADAVWGARLVMGGIGAALAMFWVAPAYRRAVLRPRLRRLPKGFWRFTLPAGAAAAVGAMVMSRVEVIVLTWMSAMEAAGIFALAFGLAVHLFSPAQSLVGPLIPAVSGLHEVDRPAVARALTRTLRASSTALALIVAGLVPFFAFLTPVLYGEEFREASEVLLALGIAGALVVIVGPLKAFIMARLHGVRLLVFNVVALAVNITLMLILVPHLGVWGAVIGNAGAALTQIVLVLGGEARMLRLTFGQALAGIAPYLLGALVSVTVWFAVSALEWNPVPSAITAVGTGLVLLVVALRLLRVGLTSADTEVIVTALPKPVRGVGRFMLNLCAGARMTEL
ncbi:oligosaccharide flippase family protein [Pseudactinotalea sp. Z1732]|uniref:oligosaccharide flippase family protein n=2 Tax=Micrococcales TaxID=85006 RepID=UPI003C7AB3C6